MGWVVDSGDKLQYNYHGHRAQPISAGRPKTKEDLTCQCLFSAGLRLHSQPIAKYSQKGTSQDAARIGNKDPGLFFEKATGR